MSKSSLESLFGDEKIDIDCPQCQKKFEVKLKFVINDLSIVQCPNCLVDIELKHDDTTKETITNANNAAEDFDKALKDLDKTFKKFFK